MKKSLILCLLLAIVSIMVTGCSSCQTENKNKEQEVCYHDYDGIVQDFTSCVSSESLLVSVLEKSTTQF